MFASLRGKRIVITGSSSGIGRAIALACAQAGADVVVHCRRSLEAAQHTAAAVRQLGVQAHVLSADVADENERRQFFEACLALGPVHGLVNNAGADLLTTELRNASFLEKLHALLSTDVVGTVELSRAFGHWMQKQADPRQAGASPAGASPADPARADPPGLQGVILNIGWDQSDRGMEGDSGELFATAKNAVMGFSRSLAVSLAPTVRVNCIAPGWILTAWGESASEYWQHRVTSETPLKCWGQPEDIANMARYLLSDQAAYITGQVINVNGGAVR